MLSKILIVFIKVYQKLFSPNHSYLANFYLGFSNPPVQAGCRFYPSCSEYFILALQKEGFIKGSFLGIKRILKCNPFNDGGIDTL